MIRWVRSARPGRGDEGPPDPATVALVTAALPLLGPTERWVLPAVPGSQDHPGPGAPRGPRDRWWRERVSTVGGALIVVDPDVPPRSVGLAVELLVACALARERGVTDPRTVAGGLPPVLTGARRHVGAGVGADTVLDSVRTAVALVRDAGLR